MITSAKNYTKKNKNKKTDRQNPRTNGKSKTIQTNYNYPPGYLSRSTWTEQNLNFVGKAINAVDSSKEECKLGDQLGEDIARVSVRDESTIRGLGVVTLQRGSKNLNQKFLLSTEVFNYIPSLCRKNLY